MDGKIYITFVIFKSVIKATKRKSVKVNIMKYELQLDII